MNWWYRQGWEYSRTLPVSYDEDYVEQMLRYSKDYSPLPSVNN